MRYRHQWQLRTAISAGLFTRRPAGCSPAGAAAKIATDSARLSAGRRIPRSFRFPPRDAAGAGSGRGRACDLAADGVELRGQVRAGDAVVSDAALALRSLAGLSGHRLASDQAATAVPIKLTTSSG